MEEMMGDSSGENVREDGEHHTVEIDGKLVEITVLNGRAIVAPIDPFAIDAARRFIQGLPGHRIIEIEYHHLPKPS